MALSPSALRKLLKAPAGPTGNRVRAAMDAAELTQAQLAERIGLSQPYISDVARGKFRTVTVDNAHKFADFFGCSIEDLFPAQRETVDAGDSEHSERGAGHVHGR